MTINQVVYNFLRNNSAIDDVLNGVFYIEADAETPESYLTVQMIDDPKDSVSFSVDDQGQSRFLLSLFQKSYTTGINNRNIIQTEVKKLEATITSGINIFRVKIENIYDREKTIDNLYQFSIEVSFDWET